MGVPASLERFLSSKFPKIKFTVSPKADSLYPMVSAASILAKVPCVALIFRFSEMFAWKTGILPATLKQIGFKTKSLDRDTREVTACFSN